MNSVDKKVALSTLGNLTNQAVRAGQQLLWVPLFLAAFGKEGYGEWLTLFGLAGYVTLADLGVQHYWLNLLTGAHVRGETDKFRRLFRAGILLFACVGGLSLVASAVFSYLHGPSRVLRLETISSLVASIVFLVLVGNTLLAVLSRMVRGVFRTVGHNPKVVWFEVSRESLTLALVAVALLMGFGPMGLALVYGGIAVLMVVWVVGTVRRRFPYLADLRIHRADRATVGVIAGGGSIHLAGVLANLLLVQGTLIITNWALGATVVALVATSRTIANLVRQAAGSVYLSTLPEFSRLEAAGDILAMRSLLRRSISFVLLTSGLACVGLVGLGPWLFDIWTGGRFENAAPLIYLFAASVVVDAVRMPLHDFLLGCNRIALVSLTDIVYAVSSLLVMWFLFPFLQAWAVPIATIICGIAIHLPSMIAGTCAVVGREVRVVLGRPVAGVFLSLAFIFAFLLFIDVGALSVAMRVVTVFVTAALYTTVSYLVMLTDEDKTALTRMARRFPRIGYR